MSEKELINHITLAINANLKDWVVFANGTYIILDDSLKEDPSNNALKIIKEFGPVYRGSPAGDLSITKLDKTDGWSVGGHYNGLYTYVHPDELVRAGMVECSDLDVGLYARAKRDKDSRDLKIIYVNNR
ncbi:MAG TPA: hypothetical protein VFD56_05475 [Chitinophagaceae bacterium]|nr:hypothetical protein [Chitinophagaceae bacterium]